MPCVLDWLEAIPTEPVAVMTEPSVFITDVVLGVFSIVLGVLLYRKSDRRFSSILWAVALLLIGSAALTGGTVHGFRLILPSVLIDVFWKVTVMSIGIAAFCFFSGAALVFSAQGWRRGLIGVAGVQLVAYVVWMVGHDSFNYVLINYSPLMVGVLILAGRALMRGTGSGAGWAIAGIAVSMIAVLVQIIGLEFHTHFNQNDIYHIVQMVALYCFYRGALLFENG